MTQGKHHPIDEMAQRLYEIINKDVAALAAMIAGPTPVGSKKLTSAQRAAQLLKMSPEQTLRAISHLSPKQQVFSSALDQLGAHGLALLPYLQTAEPMPYGPSTGSEEVF